MKYPHTGRQPPLQLVHDGIKLRIGVDLGVTIPDTINTVLENVIDHQSTSYVDFPADTAR